MPWRFREGSLLISRTVSSLATASEGAAPGPPETAQDARAVASRPGADAAFGLVLAAGLTLLAFITRGGTDLGTDGLGQNTWAEIILVLIGAGLAVAVVVAGARGRLWGGGTLLAFAAVTALSAISIAWSVQPANSWQTADQAFAYLLAFGGAAGARAPGSGPLARTGGCDCAARCRRLRLGAAGQGVPGDARSGRAVRAPESAV